MRRAGGALVPDDSVATDAVELLSVAFAATLFERNSAVLQKPLLNHHVVTTVA